MKVSQFCQNYNFVVDSIGSILKMFSRQNKKENKENKYNVSTKYDKHTGPLISYQTAAQWKLSGYLNSNNRISRWDIA